MGSHRAERTGLVQSRSQSRGQAESVEASLWQCFEKKLHGGTEDVIAQQEGYLTRGVGLIGKGVDENLQCSGNTERVSSPGDDVDDWLFSTGTLRASG